MDLTARIRIELSPRGRRIRLEQQSAPAVGVFLADLLVGRAVLDSYRLRRVESCSRNDASGPTKGSRNIFWVCETGVWLFSNQQIKRRA
jgi:hypothetical protein